MFSTNIAFCSYPNFVVICFEKHQLNVSMTIYYYQEYAGRMKVEKTMIEIWAMSEPNICMRVMLSIIIIDHLIH